MEKLSNMITIKNAGLKDIPKIRYLADTIWPDTYKTILSLEQIDYMMNLFYGTEALRQQMEELQHQFLLVCDQKIPIGFASYSSHEEEGVYKLHKIYVLPRYQGKGVGKIIIEHVINEVRTRGGTMLELNVNRHNKARFFYERLGFIICKEEDIPIGEGYYMNDYVMRKPLNHAS